MLGAGWKGHIAFGRLHEGRHRGSRLGDGGPTLGQTTALRAYRTGPKPTSEMCEKGGNGHKKHEEARKGIQIEQFKLSFFSCRFVAIPSSSIPAAGVLLQVAVERRQEGGRVLGVMQWRGQDVAGLLYELVGQLPGQ